MLCQPLLETCEVSEGSGHSVLDELRSLYRCALFRTGGYKEKQVQSWRFACTLHDRSTTLEFTMLSLLTRAHDSSLQAAVFFSEKRESGAEHLMLGWAKAIFKARRRLLLEFQL